jgi:hypothetical protein
MTKLGRSAAAAAASIAVMAAGGGVADAAACSGMGNPAGTTGTSATAPATTAPATTAAATTAPADTAPGVSITSGGPTGAAGGSDAVGGSTAPGGSSGLIDPNGSDAGRSAPGSGAASANTDAVRQIVLHRDHRHTHR